MALLAARWGCAAAAPWALHFRLTAIARLLSIFTSSRAPAALAGALLAVGQL